MTTTNDVVNTYFAAFDQSDFEKITSILIEDVVFDPALGDRILGASAVRDHFLKMAQYFDETTGDHVIFADDNGSRAAVEFTLRGRYQATFEGFPAASNQSYSVSAGAFFELDTDRAKIARATIYLNQSGLLAQLRN
ncbi:MAG: nuclear transport factor 2 family protein [Pseudomonadota bacterium]